MEKPSIERLRNSYRDAILQESSFGGMVTKLLGSEAARLSQGVEKA